MRLFLDAHISGRRIARALRERGHDVRAADEERELDGLDDPDLFVLAVRDGQVFVTANVKDYLPIVREWGEAGRPHCGCLLVARSVGQPAFGLIIAGIERAVRAMPDPAAWQDRVVWLNRQAPDA
jgi:nucleoside-diphosphate-sugar epimerase